MATGANVSQVIVETVNTITPTVVISNSHLEVVQGFQYNYLNVSQCVIEVLMSIPPPIIKVQEM